MKKVLAILLAVLMVFCLSACESGGSNPPAPQNDSLNQESLAAYDSFLKGSMEAYADETFYCFKEGNSYHIDGMCEAFAKSQDEDYYEVEDYDIMYAYLDCGNDGVQELLIHQILYSEYDSMNMDYFLKYDCENDKLNLITGFESYYRTWTEINYYGYIATGGSGGAAYWNADYYYIDETGKCNFVYSVGFDASMPKAMIPYYHIPEEKQPEGYSEIAYSWGEDDHSIYCEYFNFMDYDELVPAWDEPGYEEKYREYCDNYFYSFYDDYDKDVEPCEEYAALYDELGIKIYSQEESKALVKERCDSFGATEEIINCDIQLEYNYVGDDTTSITTNEDGSVTVNSVEGLVNSIQDGAVIYLEPGEYNFSKWLRRHRYDYNGDDATCRRYQWANAITDKVFCNTDLFIINRVNNLTIVAQDPEHPAELIIDNPYSFVVSFCECQNLKLQNLVAGHSKGNEGVCNADVFEFYACDNIYMIDCDLYGCGAHGFEAQESINIDMMGGAIHDCSYGMVESYDSRHLSFTNVDFRNVTDGYTMFILSDSDAYFEGCTFTNLGDMFGVTNGRVDLVECVYDDNAIRSIESNSDYGECIFIDHGVG